MEAIFDFIRNVYSTFVGIVSVIPGSDIVINYIKESYQNDPFRIVLEGMLIIFTIKYLASKRYKPDASMIKLSEKEIEELIKEWEPEPLAPVSMSKMMRLNSETCPEITSQSGLNVTLADGRTAINAASYNFLGLANHEIIKAAAVEALRKYGVGTCGPPGFYGTLDVHLELEAKLAKFLGTEASIIYSQAFSAVSSVVPAFAKRSDIIICDQGVHFALQKGVQISRSHVYYFKHNDMADLERVLEEVDRAYLKKPLTRRFIVAEALSMNHGDICPLPKLIELKEKYRYRLILDESLSIGALGRRGAGITEHYGLAIASIDIVTGSFSHALSACGGFCAGSVAVVDHQRLSGQAYCFSASLPALLAVSALTAIGQLEQHPEWIPKLHANASLLMTHLVTLKDLTPKADKPSPIIHLYLKDKKTSFEEEAYLLQRVVDAALNRGLLLTRAKYVDAQELLSPRPSIRICVSAGFSEPEINAIGSKIHQAVAAAAL